MRLWGRLSYRREGHDPDDLQEAQRHRLDIVKTLRHIDEALPFSLASPDKVSARPI